ncbi:MAG: hypothetical protein EBV32_03000 [Proteobacteria bacterium]|uniref:Uncharacterized protein n=1 Tax=Candidatus Fonsibacter lacus TaxID=2576439 RepID=A0A964V0L3_9PROT|nr:hypothetical protein [Candidatus Fonsibacter lacus]NCU72153.1 hypothetical protein [Candidatus Fonsibacter lacus]
MAEDGIRAATVAGLPRRGRAAAGPASDGAGDASALSQHPSVYAEGDFSVCGLLRGGKTMTKRVCGNCRWWSAGPTGSGYCQRRSPISVEDLWPITGKGSSCGEWADVSITPEDEERQELIRRFAVALVTAGGPIDDSIWYEAAELAALEPQIQRENEQ